MWASSSVHLQAVAVSIISGGAMTPYRSAGLSALTRRFITWEHEALKGTVQLFPYIRGKKDGGRREFLFLLEEEESGVGNWGGVGRRKRGQLVPSGGPQMVLKMDVLVIGPPGASH